MGCWKLVNAAPGKPWQLYDLETDGGETQDLAARQPEQVREMSKRFEAWRVHVGDRSKTGG